MRRLRVVGAAVEKRFAGNRQANRAAHRADPQPRTAAPNQRLQDPDNTVKTAGIQPHPLLALAGSESPELVEERAELEIGLVGEPFSTNSGGVIPQTTPPLILGESFEHEVLRHAIFQLYLRGYTRDAMGKKLGISRTHLRGHLEAIRSSVLVYMENNPEVFGAPLEALYLQVLRRRERQSALWEELGAEDQRMESVRPQYYRLLHEEDKAIENLLGLDHRTISVVVGTPMEQAQADLLRTMGPEKLKELLADLRETHAVLIQGEYRDGSVDSIVVEGLVREEDHVQNIRPQSVIQGASVIGA
jgi:hypothetical protein